MALSAQVSLDRQVIGATGGEGGNSSINVSYTVGETMVETLSGGGITLTQGFQQPSAIMVGINGPKGPEWSVKQFPNPTDSWFTLQLEGDYTGSIQVRIVDISGRLVHQSTLEKGPTMVQQQFNMQPFAAGQYFLTLYAEGQLSETLAIQKVN